MNSWSFSIRHCTSVNWKCSKLDINWYFSLMYLRFQWHMNRKGELATRYATMYAAVYGRPVESQPKVLQAQKAVPRMYHNVWSSTKSGRNHSTRRVGFPKCCQFEGTPQARQIRRTYVCRGLQPAGEPWLNSQKKSDSRSGKRRECRCAKNIPGMAPRKERREDEPPIGQAAVNYGRARAKDIDSQADIWRGPRPQLSGLSKSAKENQALTPKHICKGTKNCISTRNEFDMNSGASPACRT